MKILQINCVYPVGSTGRIVEAIDDYLQKNHEQSIICYGRGRKLSKTGVYKVSSEIEAKIHSGLCMLSGMRFAYSPIATSRLIRIIKREKPDVVHLHCLNGNFVNVYELLEFLKKQRIKTVMTLHAEIMHTAGCEHAYDCEKWKDKCNDCPRIRGLLTHYFRDDALVSFKRIQKAFNGFQDLTIVGVSKWLTDRATNSGVFRNCKASFITVENGVNTKVFFRDLDIAKQLRIKHGLMDKKVVLHVTPDFRLGIKGGSFVLELAQQKPEWFFVIVGYNGKNENLPPNVVTVSHTDNQREMRGYYSMSDVTLITSKRETFSMVCAESLCCGTPVVGFNAGGPESIALPEFSHFVPFGDTFALRLALEDVMQRRILVDTNQTKLRYAQETMSHTYVELYKWGKIN